MNVPKINPVKVNNNLKHAFKLFSAINSAYCSLKQITHVPILHSKCTTFTVLIF